MLKLGLEIKATGWIAKCAALKDTFASLPVWVLSYEGMHSALHVPNATIAKHALAHGDNVFCVQQATLNEMARKVRTGLLRIVKGTARGRTDLRVEMTDALNIAVAGLTTAILEGKTGGPSRRPEWNAYKASKWTAPTPDMVASREWLRSLKGRIVDRASVQTDTGSLSLGSRLAARVGRML